MSFAASFGCNLTLMGAASNVVVNGALEDLGVETMSFFELGKVGIPITVAGMSAVSAGMSCSGAGALIADTAVKLLGEHPNKLLVLAIILILVTLLTNAMMNTSCALLVPPLFIPVVQAFGMNTTTAMIMGLIRNTAYYDREVRKGNWPKCQYLLPPDVRELTLGLYGFGLVGRHLHDIFHKGFGTRVIACDPYVSQAVKDQYPDVEFVDFDTLVQSSDIISIHVILTPETTHVFNREVFKRMKNTAMIINTSRGPVIDNDDLAWALETGEIRYAGLDTVEHEPLPENDPFKRLDNIIVNPHCGSYGVGSKKTQISMVCRLIPEAVGAGKLPGRCVADKGVLSQNTGYEFI